MEKDPEASLKLNVESTRTLAEAVSEFRLRLGQGRLGTQGFFYDKQ